MEEAWRESGSGESAVEDDGAEGEWGGGGCDKARLVEAVEHFGAREECIYRMGEVFVGPGGVSRDPCGGVGHDLGAVEVVERADQGVGGDGKLQDQQSASRAENPSELPHGLQGVLYIANAERDGDHVAAGVGERKCLGVAVEPGEVLCAAGGVRGGGGMHRGGKVSPGGFGLGDGEHFVGEVDPDDLALWRTAEPGDGVREFECQITCSTGNIDNCIGRLKPGVLDCFPTPVLVDKEGMKTIVEVVGGGDGREHLPHARGFIVNDVWICEQLAIPDGRFCRT